MSAQSQAHDFRLEDQNRTEVSLKQFRGQWVVLYFYPKDNTPGCTVEAIDFTKRLKDFSKLNAVILGVSADNSESHCQFIDDHQLKIRLLSDPEHKPMNDYGVWQLKKNYGKEYMGVVRSTFLIDPKGQLAHEWRNVQAEGHAEKVLSQLKDLIAI